MRVFENRVLGRIFLPKGYEEAGDWRGLCKNELCNLFVSPNIIKVIK
jgi:hypothetical protein